MERMTFILCWNEYLYHFGWSWNLLYNIHTYIHVLPFFNCTGFSRLEVLEKALDGIPLDLGLVVKTNLHAAS